MPGREQIRRKRLQTSEGEGYVRSPRVNPNEAGVQGQPSNIPSPVMPRSPFGLNLPGRDSSGSRPPIDTGYRNPLQPPQIMQPPILPPRFRAGWGGWGEMPMARDPGGFNLGPIPLPQTPGVRVPMDIVNPRGFNF